MLELNRILVGLLMSVLGFNSHAVGITFSVLEEFGNNPGELQASYYKPNVNNPTIVVLLHGCMQNGQELAQNSGLLNLAKGNFALLLPQQSTNNNIKSCFNWYSANDYSRDSGESLSIKNMIISLKNQLQSHNIYIIGLSGGGAMSSVMLVNYPELFTAGAVIAGIPFPCADGLITAISCMKNGPSQTVFDLTSQIKQQNDEPKKWPKLSVWTGSNDKIVNPSNSVALARQWAGLRQIQSKPNVSRKPGYTISEWHNKQKQVQVELIEVEDLGHGIMVNPEVRNGGTASDFLLESPISTVMHVTKTWHLVNVTN